MQTSLLSPSIATDFDVGSALDIHAPVAIGVSGGKDSSAVALSTVDYLDGIGHRGERILIHSDLGRTEWKESLPMCHKLADQLDLELVVVRRQAGDMLDRWQTRWSNNVIRYQNLECVKVILPWSTPSMRFCTSELKTTVICRELKRRYKGWNLRESGIVMPESPIISVVGIRRQESTGRAKKPVASPQPLLLRRSDNTHGFNWNPIIEWSLDDVLAYLRRRGMPLHEAYTKYGTSRVSCCFCILSARPDLLAASTCPDNHDVYRLMVQLEIDSSFAFQSGGWLGDVAPQLLTGDQQRGLVRAKKACADRELAESWLPDHLLYARGWPTCVPSTAESKRLAKMRRQVRDILGLADVKYLTGDSVSARYHHLFELQKDKVK